MASEAADQRRQSCGQFLKASFPGTACRKTPVFRQQGTNLLRHWVGLLQKTEQGIGRIEAPNDHDDQRLDKELVAIGLLPPTLALGWGRWRWKCSTSQSKLTRILPGVSISVPPKYEVWSLQYFRGSRAPVNPSARLYIDFRSFRFMTTSELILSWCKTDRP